MGDLNVNEAFTDKVFIQVKSTGVAATGLTPTCTIIDNANARTDATVTEIGNGWYQASFTPTAAGIWATEWGGIDKKIYLILHSPKIFKVGGGVVADIDSNVDLVKAETDQLSNWRFQDKLSTTPTVDSVSSDSETSLTAGSVTPTFPTGATRQRALLVATLHVANASEALHKIGLTLQIKKDDGSYSDVVDLTTNPPISLAEVDGAVATFGIVCDVTSTVNASGSTYSFKWLVDSDNAGNVKYTSNFILIMIYSM